jgi:hypothetical protein
MSNFEKVLDRLREIHYVKSQGYGRTGRPFYNIEAAGELIGVPAWVAAISRLGDKVGRISAHLNGADITDEKLLDNLEDLAVYAVIALALYDEQPTRPGVDTDHFQERINFLIQDLKDKGFESLLRPDDNV